MAFWDEWFQGIVKWMTSIEWNQRPQSAAVIAVTAVLVAIISTLITRLVTDVDALKESMQKVNEWNKRKKQAMQTADKKLWLSVKRDEERIKKMQSSMMFKRMKPMLFTTIPFLLIFAILRNAFPTVPNYLSDVGHYYAWLPFDLGEFPWIGNNAWLGSETFNGKTYSKASFTIWYFISAFAFGSIISRIFGVTPSGATKTKTKKPEQKQVKTPVSAAKAELAKKRTSSKNK
jgi:uncharacterized membrane protein (DUF106 family)